MLAAAIARWLESGRFDGRAARAMASAHATFAARAVARPLRIPVRPGCDAPLFTITVGGATLGGSGRTRVALACTRELARRGVAVVLVGHAYRAAPLAPRVVTVDDDLREVGDEALACARALSSLPNACVVVGPTRQSAVDHAAALARSVEAIVIDGPLQLAPERASLSILALDADAPWGAGDLPPAGDLRAPRDALLAHADHVVLVDATPARVTPAMRGARVGLFTALARPARLERGLARAGIVPKAVVRARDHGPVTAADRRRLVDSRVELWLATAKCATHLEGLGLDVPVAILDGSLVLPEAVQRALDATAPAE